MHTVKREPRSSESDDEMEAVFRRMEAEEKERTHTQSSHHRKARTTVVKEEKEEVMEKKVKLEPKQEESPNAATAESKFSVNDPTELIEQYHETEAYDETNRSNTEEIRLTLQALEEYVYRLYGEGEATMTMVSHFTQLFQLVTEWNSVITAQQKNMRDLVSNAIIYYTELYDKHNELTRLVSGPNRRKNPASPFNTVQTDVETILVSNENRALKSGPSTTIHSIF